MIGQITSITLYSPDILRSVSRPGLALYNHTINTLVFTAILPEGVLLEHVRQRAHRTSAWLMDSSVEAHGAQVQISLSGSAVDLAIGNLLYEIGFPEQIMEELENLILHLKGHGPAPDKQSATTVADFIRLVEGLVAPG